MSSAIFQNHVILTQKSFHCTADFVSKTCSTDLCFQNVFDRFLLPKRSKSILTESMCYNSARRSARLIRLIAFSRKTVSNKHKVYGTKIKENAHTCIFSENTSHLSHKNNEKIAKKQILCWSVTNEIKFRFFGWAMLPICKL